MTSQNICRLPSVIFSENYIIQDWEGAKIKLMKPNKRTQQLTEAVWIRKTKTPMNRDEGSYELPHVYDDVICH